MTNPLLSAASTWQTLSQWHENQRLIDFVASTLGQILLWCCCLLLLYPTPYLPLLPLMILASRLPAQRIPILGIGGAVLFFWFRFAKLPTIDPLWIASDIAFIVGILWLFFQLARHYSALPKWLRNSPQIALHSLLWLCIAAIPFFPNGFRNNPDNPFFLHASLCVLLFSFLIWRIGMLLYAGKRGQLKTARFVDHLLYCLPYLGPTQVPYGKGLDYLQSKQAKQNSDLAKSQLAGVKLLLLALLWQALLPVLNRLFFASATHSHDSLSTALIQLYHVDFLTTLPVERLPPLATLWGSLFIDMIYETMQLAITGHFIVGCFRLFGFNIFRNTYRPLLTKSLVDFWNQYYYYFKELLVDFFFFPAYISLFKNNIKLRIFTATMASACVGNFYYHILQHFDVYLEHGVTITFEKFASYLFYSVVLGFGIFISMLNAQQRRTLTPPAYTPLQANLVVLRKIAGVWLFFSLLRIWDHPSSQFWQDTRFFFTLFGLSF
ncbi:hypothetical protein [Candidatus Magnetaquicoccus inordinatus]|uniref:hypothetical protein n=1 Tax=Candidatus Magnetaquicoccus inordinatus TaxID=2496818 RepID=UPI00102CBF91|nr:hypothetical protein [Candidatus Magnetaquicoccus inordinatus]